MNFSLKIWRQKDAKSKGAFKTYRVENISPDTSFLEMLDILNNNLVHAGEEPVAFDHDCREGICGMCSLHINGHAHGPEQAVTTCQLYMRCLLYTSKRPHPDPLPLPRGTVIRSSGASPETSVRHVPGLLRSGRCGSPTRTTDRRRSGHVSGNKMCIRDSLHLLQKSQCLRNQILSISFSSPIRFFDSLRFPTRFSLRPPF